jgi:uncharacterized OB-fold protein
MTNSLEGRDQLVVGPSEDEDSAPFWSAVRKHRLMVQQCMECDVTRFPPMPCCPHCGVAEASWVDAPPQAQVYSWVRVHRTSSEAFSGSVPYTIVTAELAPGCRMVGRLEGTAAAAIGEWVEPVFVDHPDWTEVRFSVQCAATSTTPGQGR